MNPNSPQTSLPSGGIIGLDATQLVAAIRARQVSCREVIEAHLDRIAQVNERVNAIVSLRSREYLLADADAADADLIRGHWRGPMHGLPHAVKDLAPTRGLRTTFGSPIFAEHVPQEDALFVERLRKAGAILIGKTNVSEFGLGSHSYNPVWGTTLNAYDTALSAGGSSGGAAVATALRMVPMADGSDFAGSLRNPAGWNGIFGFRPSAGRVPSLPGPEAYLQQLATDGPMARTVADLALLLSVMSGPDPRAPLSLAEPGPTADLPAGIGEGTRIGWLGDFVHALPLEAGILPLSLTGLSTLGTAGCRVEEASLGMSRDEIWACWLVWRHVLVGSRYRPLYDDPEKRALMKPELIWEIEGGLSLSADDLYRASATRTRLYQRFLSLFADFDALALPSAQVFPFAHGLSWPRTIAGTTMDTYHRWMEVVVPATLSGCPTICLPLGAWGPDGRSSGLQLIGRPGQDQALLRLARAFEAVSRPTERLPA
ncbi:amidase [Methylobacterium marchantiae]|uniref:Indoleacetamide hydrolase n=1 Tax=Methylobacterium marchantiae TaxID=600331 RepID=A0ABW3WX04_9HYPH|nr:Acylamidase [Methylobacterium marchantiae]